MRIIHCTQKLLKELGNSPLQSPDTAPVTEGLCNWYANLIKIDRRKCLLFTNEKTLYSFLIPRVMKQNLQNLEEEFLINLNLNLQAEGFSIKVINRVLQEYREIGFAKTVSKRVLGSMNDFAFQCEFLIRREGGIENTKILWVNKALNTTPMGALRYRDPIEVLKGVLEAQ